MGDKHLFAAAMAAKYSRKLKRFLATRVRNTADASDLAQEIFLRLLRIEHHESIRSPEAYLFTIASHILHQYSLRLSGAPEAVDIEELCAELMTVGEDDPSSQADMQQRIEHLERALEELPPMEKSALLLHRYAGFSIEEIGKQLGVARPTAKKYLAKALVHCRNQRQVLE